jgi:hypothetical protein
VVETGGLENRFTRKGNGGSNPSPSAIKNFNRIAGISGTTGSISVEIFGSIISPGTLYQGLLQFINYPNHYQHGRRGEYSTATPAGYLPVKIGGTIRASPFSLA